MLRRTTLALAAVLVGGLLAPGASGAAPADTRLVDAPCAPGQRKDAPPYGGGSCPGVRPGGRVLGATGDCTIGFVFAGSDGRRYAATAGHCVLEADAEKAWPLDRRGNPPASAPVARDSAGKQIGRFAYAIVQGELLDFALVRIDRGVAVDPQMCHFGGPTGLNSVIDEDLIELRHVGQGLGSALTARTAWAPFGLYRDDVTYAWGAAWYGDSGGPVVDAKGRAVGVVTHLVASGLGDIRVNRLAPHVTRAQRLLRVALTLQTAPTL